MRSAFAPVLGLALATTAFAQQPGAAVDVLLERGRLQEAAWAAREAGDTARGERILARLDSILRRPPRDVAPLGMDSQGVSFTFRLHHGDSVASIFKMDGSDIFCPACGADREVATYRVDRLLGIDLTPTTVPLVIVHDGDTLNGSSMYFIRDARIPAEAGLKKPDRMRFFDAVLGNTDRHGGNWLVGPDDRVVAIDHNRAFEYGSESRPKTCWETEIDSIAAPDALGPPYERYRSLSVDSLAAAVRDVLEPGLVERFVAMRDRVVERIERRIRDPRRPQPIVECRWDG